MVYLEKKGRVKSPSRETYTTNYEEQSQYVSVKDKVQEQEETGNESFFKESGTFFQDSFSEEQRQFLLYYQKGRRDFPHACMGADTSASFLLEAFDPAMIVALFFECRYSFKGKDNLDGVNKGYG